MSASSASSQSQQPSAVVQATRGIFGVLFKAMFESCVGFTLEGSWCDLLERQGMFESSAITEICGMPVMSFEIDESEVLGRLRSSLEEVSCVTVLIKAYDSRTPAAFDLQQVDNVEPRFLAVARTARCAAV